MTYYYMVFRYTVGCKKNCRLVYKLYFKLFHTFFERSFPSYLQTLDTTFMHPVNLVLLENFYIASYKLLILQAPVICDLTNRSYYIIEVLIIG